jgi:heme-degrading monooxygenase HmoA
MIVALTITKFRGFTIPFAFIGMAILRFPLWLNKSCRFWKLMGSGKDAQVDLAPDYKHWAVLTTWDNRNHCDVFYRDSFVMKWFGFFGIESFTILLKPLSSHGLWSKVEPFKVGESNKNHAGKIAVITRAAIKFDRLKEFRQNIKRAAGAMRTAPGFILSAGIGENPFFDQATFSIWTDADSMKAYAYKSFDHADVIKLTREREWYKEELFARFEIIDSWGSLNGVSIDV